MIKECRQRPEDTLLRQVRVSARVQYAGYVGARSGAERLVRRVVRLRWRFKVVRDVLQVLTK